MRREGQLGDFWSLRTSVRRYAGIPTQTRTAAAAEKTMKAIGPWPRNDNASTIKAQIKRRPTTLRRPSVVRGIDIGRLLPEFLLAELGDVVNRFMATA